MCDEHESSRIWIEGLRSGNNEVVRSFCEQFGPALQQVADRRMSPALKRRVGADDVVQSVCRTFFRRAARGEFEMSRRDDLWRLLCAVTLTKVREAERFHRRQRRSMRREVEIDREPTARMGADTLEAEFADELDRLLTMLDDVQRKVVALRLEDCSTEEIAKTLRCSTRTVRRILHGIRETWSSELQSVTQGDDVSMEAPDARFPG